MYIKSIFYDILIMGGCMYNRALEVLNMFYKHGYVAYIVGGYPRDKYIGINSSVNFIYSLPLS